MGTSSSVRSIDSRSRIYQLGRDLLRRGVADLFRSPDKAAAYWRRIAAAGINESSEKEKDNGLFAVRRSDLETILPGADSVPVTLVDYQYENGDMPVHELMALCRIVRSRNPRAIFEIATFNGGTTLQLAANSNARIYTLDLPPAGHPGHTPPTVWNSDLDVYPVQPGIRFRHSSYSERIQQIFADSQSFDFGPYRGSMDLILVDGCHHYEFVRRDSENALKMRSPAGIVFWHDYAPHAPDVMKYLNELSRAIPLSQITGTSLVFHST